MDIDVESLTDAELRSKLIEFGYPVMPITGTTRKIMKKKLRMLMDSKTKAKDSRRSLGRYSSEEESDSEPRKEAKRRQTLAAPMQPPSPARRRRPEPPAVQERKTVSTRTLKIVQTAKDEFDTGSESDEVADKYEASPPKESPDAGFKRSPGRLPSSFVSASLAADAASDRLSQIRARHSLNSTSYLSSPDDLLTDKENTPFLSNFTKRLSQLSESPKATHYDYKNDIIKENDVNGGTSRAYLSSYRASRGRPSSYDYKLTNQSIFKNNFVPFMVLVVAFLFFIVVAMVYLGIRSDSASVDVTATLPKCVKADGRDCVTDGKGALQLLKVLRLELNRRFVATRCDDAKAKPYMTEPEIVSFVTSNFLVQNESKVRQDLHNLQVLSFVNPTWGISVLLLDEDGAAFAENKVAASMDQVLSEKHRKVTALITSNCDIPWTCYLYNTVWSLLYLVLLVTSAFLIVYPANYGYKLFKSWRQRRHEEELAIVENIIDILQTNASDNDVNYMIINHIRDMILPINDRKSKQKLWASAVKYIEENESRIRTEQKTVQGEVYDVWRWLGAAHLNTSTNKSWQGQAFETQVGSVNSLPVSPTPCLKIRGMVEEGDRNTLVIKRAILTKCAQECRILHCSVDLSSKCVYLKCYDTGDAAVAYRNLHGWWYSGHLVTVKYLRLERYMQRFPDSPVSGPPFLQ